MWLLAHLLNRFIRNGVLRLIAADGTLHMFGGHGPGPTVTVRLHDPRLYTKLFLNPELHAGEAYMNGTLTFEDGSDVGCFMQLFAVNRGGLAAHPVRHCCGACGAPPGAGTRPIPKRSRRPTPAITTTSRPSSTGCSSTTA